MQVPERLALIGGSILLASTLIFTLKSQASSILPKITHPISNIYDHVGDAQKASEFDDDFKQAQKDNLPTGTWGTAKYYIDKNDNMYVGDGDLQTSIENAIGNDQAAQINSLNFMRDVRAPQNSANLFSTLSNAQTINGLDRVDMSQATSMDSMFSMDTNLKDLDLSSWDTSQVKDISWIFHHNDSLRTLNISSWNTKGVNEYGHLLDYDYNLTSLSLGSNTYIYGAWLPDHTYPNPNGAFPYDNDKWTNGNTTLSSWQLSDQSYQQSLPGTWYKP